MDPFITGSLIGAGANLLGGWLSGQSNKESSAAANAEARAHSLRQEELQREFAQKGIQWKAADARAAGFHPLAALGAQGAMYSPTTYSPMPEGDGGAMGQAVSNAGSQVSNLMFQREMQKEMLASQAETQSLTNEGIKLDNLLKQKQLNVPLIEGNKDSGTFESGWSGDVVPDYTFSMSDDGAVSIVPSQQVKNLIEDQLVPETQWASRNTIGDTIQKHMSSDKQYKLLQVINKKLGTNYNALRWDKSRQQFVPVRELAGPPKLKKFYRGGTYK